MLEEFVCVDLETTGLNPKLDRIIEIGAVLVRNGQVADTFQSLINPRCFLEERITELTGISEKDLEDAPYLDEIFPKFLEFVGDRPLLGHSVLFDYSFLKKAAVDRKIAFERKGVDTLRIARRFLPELPSRGLGALCKHFAIEHQAHRALGDALATVKLYEILSEQYYKEEEACFQPEALIFKVKRDQPATPSQKQKLYRLLEGHAKSGTNPDWETIPPINVEGLTRSEASRWTDKILAKNGSFYYNGNL